MVARRHKIEQVENGQIIDNIEIGWLTNRGRRRDHNEDDLYVFSAPDVDYETRGMLLAVAGRTARIREEDGVAIGSEKLR